MMMLEKRVMLAWLAKACAGIAVDDSNAFGIPPYYPERLSGVKLVMVFHSRVIAGSSACLWG